jgi:hypothetical protein
MPGGGDFGTTARTEPENLRSFRLKSGQPSSRPESAIGAALDPNGTTELTIASTVSGIQASE